VDEATPETNWFRELKGDRLEVSLLADGLRMRVSGHEALVWYLVGEFEGLTGKEATGPWKRPLPKGQRQLDGQISMVDFPPEDDDGEE
jgi:hypothetical protein